MNDQPVDYQQETIRKIRWLIDTGRYMLHAMEKFRAAQIDLEDDDFVALCRDEILEKEGLDEKTVGQIVRIMAAGRLNDNLEDVVQLEGDWEEINKQLKGFDMKARPKLNVAPPMLDVDVYFRDRIHQDESTSVTALSLYDDYCYWCENTGRMPQGLPVFSRQLTDLGVQKIKMAGKIRYTGIRIAKDFETKLLEVSAG